MVIEVTMDIRVEGMVDEAADLLDLGLGPIVAAAVRVLGMVV